ncbi:hypothetical protein NL676_031483 [Syzygium grande]|nr:hypothetical protein NL676_031483 [Syzygium grande]
MAVADASSPTTQRIFRHLISPTKSDAKPWPPPPLPLPLLLPCSSSSSCAAARGARCFAGGFILTFVACTVLFVLNPATHSSAPWLTNLLAASAPASSYRSRFSSVLSRFRRDPSEPAAPPSPLPSPPRPRLPGDLAVPRGDEGSAAPHLDDRRRRSGSGSGATGRASEAALGSREDGGDVNGESPSRKEKRRRRRRTENWLRSLKKCDVYAGRWARDGSYPLYSPGSCPHIDEPFNCFLNGRRDSGYLKYRWQPNDCDIPRLSGRKMLKLLRGKRLVFVGDSLNRNMWESLVCILRNSVEDKSRVFEASGREEFRTEGSYSFIFQDYNCSVEFFQSPFLVQESEMPMANGSKRETLRLDVVEGSSDKYKNADILVFNTGHWWTHEKTSKGKDYYQEGSHIYSQLHVKEAFRKALTTWGRWIDSNIDPSKTQVFFRGYSFGHFRGGRWNSGGRCDRETAPYKEETYLFKYPRKMRIFEFVMKVRFLLGKQKRGKRTAEENSIDKGPFTVGPELFWWTKKICF